MKDKKVKTFSHEDLKEILNEGRECVSISCELLTPYVSGVPAGDKDLRAFIEHHLGIPPDDPEYQKAFDRKTVRAAVN